MDSNTRTGYGPINGKDRRWWTYALLIILTGAIYAQTAQHQFITFDDSHYIYANPHVTSGLRAETLPWAFTSTVMGNWHPLTMLSHTLDWTLFGPRAGLHHLVSVLLHILNTALTLLVLHQMTRWRPGAFWCSAVVAALFAVHPLHVESVAWASERKDVLSTLFWWLSLWAWTAYAARGRWRDYGLALLAFAAGLTAKPMVVTLPVVLLLLDHWPYDRYRAGRLRMLLVEKAPFLLLALGAGLVAIGAQRESDAVFALEQWSMAERVGNAVVTYVRYLEQTFVPVGLAFFYPRDGDSLTVARVGVAAVVLVAITAVALWQARRRPYLLAGWGWYVVTLAPVIGIVQVGNQAMADRYTYIPLTGIFIAVVWFVADLAGTRPVWRRAATALAVVCIALLSAVAFRQVSYWRDSETLYRQALRVTENNAVAHNNLGVVLANKDDWGEALEHFAAASAIAPGNVEARNNLGGALIVNERPAEALPHLEFVLHHRPEDASVMTNLAVAYMELDEPAQARAWIAQALAADPTYRPARALLGRMEEEPE